jgi:hypothetical protein
MFTSFGIVFQFSLCLCKDLKKNEISFKSEDKIIIPAVPDVDFSTDVTAVTQCLVNCVFELIHTMWMRVYVCMHSYTHVNICNKC